MVKIGDEGGFTRERDAKYDGVLGTMPGNVRIDFQLRDAHPNMFRDWADALRVAANELEALEQDRHTAIARLMRDAWWTLRSLDRKVKDRVKKPLGDVVKLLGHPLEGGDG